MTLEDLRKRIDEADARIVRLLAERLKTAGEIGKEKQRAGRPVEDAAREQRVLEHVKDIAREEGISPAAVESIYRQVVSVTRGIQGMAVAFQGEVGAYSQEAAFQFFGPEVEVQPCESFENVFRAVEQGAAQTGIVPIENSLEGSITGVYDMLLESPLRVRGETELRITHCLIAHPGTRLDEVKRVYSHPQALGQCRSYLKHMGFELVPTYDTAGSVKMLKEKGIKDGAAIASARAAEIYEMNILAREIEDNPNNYTRFFILGVEDATPTGDDKTSIVFSVKHRPGSLYEFLRVLSARNINLTKIESRPTRQKPWEYNFYLDFEGHRQDAASREALADLESQAIFIKLLGSYPRARESSRRPTR